MVFSSFDLLNAMPLSVPLLIPPNASTSIFAPCRSRILAMQKHSHSACVQTGLEATADAGASAHIAPQSAHWLPGWTGAVRAMCL